jgi:hypothetical protein
MLVILASIILFAEYYRWKDNISAVEAYYHSTLIQTLVGDEYPNKSDISKVGTIIQAFFAYAITTGLLIYWTR